MKKITTELAAEVSKFFESAEVKSLVEATEKALDTDTGSFEVVITTETIDRYDEVIKLDGWDLTHYRANPVVLWGHDHSRIIGIATDVRVEDGKMIAKGKFAPTAEGQEKRALYEAGFLRATSVGFIERERQGNLITKAELLEFSFVSVPANPMALTLAMEKELSINELVTKGIFTIKTSEETPAAPTAPVEETKGEEEPKPEELTDAEKRLVDTIVGQVVAALKDGALEEETPEGTDEQPEEEVEDETVKEFRLKQAIQALDTQLGDYLAEKRRAREAARS